MIQAVPQQRIRKARHQGTTENSHSGHCAPSSEREKVQNVYHGE